MRRGLLGWSEEVGAALRERRISNNAAAQAIGISPATFASWMSGATRPSVDLLPQIANLTGMAVWRLHELAGYLPEDYSPAAAVIQAVQKQRSLYSELQRWAEVSLEATGLTPSARVVGFLIEHDPSWQLTVRPNIKGIEFAIASNTLIALEPSRPNSAPLHQVRANLEEAVGRKLSVLGALWRHRSVPGWKHNTPLIMEVPEYERTRPRGRAPIAALPSAFVVAGVPYAHAELVGSLVAEAADYGYINMKTEACIRGELGMGSVREDVIAAIADVTRHYLTEAGQLDRMVWTCAQPEVIKSFLKIADGQAQPHMVYVRCSEELIRFGAEVHRYPVEVCQNAAKQLEKLSKALGDERCTIIDLDLPAGFSDDGDAAPHLVADAAVLAASRLLERLTARHFEGSPVPNWKGYLAQTVRRNGLARMN